MSSTSRSVLPTRGKPPVQELNRGMLVSGLQILGFKGNIDEKPFERPNTFLLANVLYFLYQRHFGEDNAQKTFQGIWPPKDVGRVPGILPQNFTKIIVDWIHDLNQGGYISNSLSLACKSLLQRAQGPRLIELLCGIIFKTIETLNKQQFGDQDVTSALSSLVQQEKSLPSDLQFVMLSMAKTQIKQNKEEALQLEQQLAEQWNVMQEANQELQDLENQSIMELQEAQRKAFEKGINTSMHLDEPQRLAQQIGTENRQRRLERLNQLWSALGEQVSQQCSHESLIRNCLSDDLFVNAISGKQLQEQAGVEDIKEELNLNQVVEGATHSLKSFQQQIQKMKAKGVFASLQLLQPGVEGGSYEYLQHLLTNHKISVETLRNQKGDLITKIKEFDQNNPILLEEVENMLQLSSTKDDNRRNSFGSQENFTPLSSRQKSPTMALMPPTPPILRHANPFAQNNQLNQLNSKQKEKNVFVPPTIYEEQNNQNNNSENNNNNNINFMEMEAEKNLRTPLTPRSLAKHNEQLEKNQFDEKKFSGVLNFCDEGGSFFQQKNEKNQQKNERKQQSVQNVASPDEMILNKMKGNMRYLSPQI